MNDFPRIWTRRPTILEPRDLVVAQAMRTPITGHFKLTVHKGDPNRPSRVLEFDNLITDAGLDMIGQAVEGVGRAVVGTGTNTPSTLDTTLQTQLAVTATVFSSSTGDQPSSPYFGHATSTFRFSQGAAAGNLTEVGVGRTTGSPVPVFSRALILDGFGSPTTLTILSDEFLDVTYTYRIYPNESDVTGGTVVIAGVTYDVTVRASLVTNDQEWLPPLSGLFGGIKTTGIGVPILATRETQTLGAITAEPSGSSGGATSGSNAAYVNGNYYRDFTLSFALGDSNFTTGIGSVRINMGDGLLNVGRGGAWQMNFSGPASAKIPKDASKIMSLTFRNSWARH